MKKRITDWLQELPEPQRTQALDNTELFPLPGAENKEVDTMHEAISGFVWFQTPQGIDYWCEVHERALRGQFN